MRLERGRQLRRWLLASAALMGMAAQAAAQDTIPPPEDEEAMLERVTVTGSRIQTDSVTSAASPVLAIDLDELITTGEADITTLLRDTPSLNGSLPGSFSAFNVADTEDSDLGLGLLDLRNLGVERTLVLQDGRRHVAGSAGVASVDVNTIPVSLLQRVEVLTGGASSIYGADAVTGVVNFILRDGASFDGIEYRFQGGLTDEGDAGEFFGSIATGFEYDNGKGDFVFGLEYFTSRPVFASDRDFAGSGFGAFVPTGLSFNDDGSVATPVAPGLLALGVDPGVLNTYVPGLPETLPISSPFGIIALGDGGASAFGGVLDEIDLGPQTVGMAGIPALQVLDGGALRPYNPGDIIIDAFNAFGGDAVPTTPDLELILPETERVVFNAKTTYALHENVNVFVDAKYAFTDTFDSVQVNGFNDDIPIALDNAFIPPELAAQIATLQGEGLDPVIAMSRDTLDADVLPFINAERQTFRIVGGFTGDLPYNMSYELSYNYGRTDVNVTNENERIEDRFFAAVDAVTLTQADVDALLDAEVAPPGAAGDIVCRSTLEAAQLDGGLIDEVSTPPVSPFPEPPSGFRTFSAGDGQCAPVNLFGLNAITGPGADFAFQTVTDRTVLTQEVAFGTLSGDTEQFFQLPGGPIGWALGFEYRRDESAFTPNGFELGGNTFGAVSSGATLPSAGSIDVIEGFIEARLPLLADLPFAELVEVTGAARFSSYDTIGRTNTWSVGGRYQPHSWLTIRGTYSEAIRAPNIGELFSPQQPDTLAADDDPCNAEFLDAGTEFREPNCLELVGPGFDSTDFNSAFVPGVSGGNPDLEPETAETFTVGVVFEPDGPLDGLRVIADFYDIEIAGAIDALTGFEVAENCVDLPTLDNAFCDAITRNPVNGDIDFFVSGQVNLGGFEVQGVDWSVSYLFDIGDSFGLGADYGTLDLSAVGTRFIQNDTIPDPLAPEVIIDELGTFNDPRWIVNFAADWTFQDLSLGWRGRFETSQLLFGITTNEAESPAFSDVLETGSGFVHDFSAEYYISEELTVYGGINNALDRDPFLGTLSRPAGPRGRFFFLGIQGTF